MVNPRQGRLRAVGKQRIKTEDLLRVIELCRGVDRRNVDPFQVDITESLEKLKVLLPEWEKLNDLLLDAKALKEIAQIVRLQRDWVSRRASTLYIDPVLVELKIRLASVDQLAEILNNNYHPIAGIDQISRSRFSQAVEYWNQLPSIADRPSGLGGVDHGLSDPVDLDELRELKVLSDEDFSQQLDRLLLELKKRCPPGDRIDYWSFIRTEEFSTSVVRAYLISFLISEGSVQLESDTLSETIFLSPIPEDASERGLRRSVVVSIDHGTWKGGNKS